MKILLIGSSGLLGNAYAEAAIRRGHKVIGLYNHNRPNIPGIEQVISFNGETPDDLTQTCLELWPDAIVNCAAISSPAEVDANPQLAEKINVSLPRFFAQLSNHIGARFIHISTDMVFDGQSKTPYRPTDIPAPTNHYGQTKLMAEREVLEHNSEDSVILRIPLLMGNSPRGQRSAHEKLLAAVQANNRPKLFCDEIRQPCSASNVAEVMLELSERRDLHGIFHWAGSETLSRFEIGQRILKHFGLPLDSIESICKNDDPTFAGRPTHLTFNLNPLLNKLKTKPASFKEQLEALTENRPLNASR